VCVCVCVCVCYYVSEECLQNKQYFSFFNIVFVYAYEQIQLYDVPTYLKTISVLFTVKRYVSNINFIVIYKILNPMVKLISGDLQQQQQ